VQAEYRVEPCDLEDLAEVAVIAGERQPATRALRPALRGEQHGERRRVEEADLLEVDDDEALPESINSTRRAFSWPATAMSSSPRGATTCVTSSTGSSVISKSISTSFDREPTPAIRNGFSPQPWQPVVDTALCARQHGGPHGCRPIR
jgi:hypothetical protein